MCLAHAPATAVFVHECERGHGAESRMVYELNNPRSTGFHPVPLNTGQKGIHAKSRRDSAASRPRRSAVGSPRAAPRTLALSQVRTSPVASDWRPRGGREVNETSRIFDVTGSRARSGVARSIWGIVRRGLRPKNRATRAVLVRSQRHVLAIATEYWDAYNVATTQVTKR